MKSIMSAIGLHRVYELFKRSERNDNDLERQNLFPPVQTSAAVINPRSTSNIVTWLLRRIRTRSAKPALCSHTVVTAESQSDPLITRPISGNQKIASRDKDNEILNAKINPGNVTPLLHINQDHHVGKYLNGSLDDDANVSNHVVRPARSCGLSDIQVIFDLPSINTTRITNPPAHEVLTEVDNKFAKITEITELIDRSLCEDVLEVDKNVPVDEDAALSKPEDQYSRTDTETVNEEEYFFAEDGKRASDTFSESSDEEEDNSIDSDVLRADWGPLKAIPEQSFRLALLKHLPADDCAVNPDSIRVLEEIEGGNNFVRILELKEGRSADRYVIKVPCTGTAARWIDSDAYMLRNDASTMSYIRKHTDVPCPEVLGFDDTLNNTLGAPYIVMRANKGIPSNKIWFDQDEEGDDDTANASLPDEDRIRIRVNFLRSLAGHMAKLQTLEFDAAGTLNFDHDAENPVVGPTYHWKTFSEMQQLTIDDLSTPASINCIPAFHSSYEYFLTALDQHWPLQEGPSNYINNGRQHIMAQILASPPFAESKKAGDKNESFTLRHDDLDFQNILCDEDGNVTAIIDWDKCRTAPRCLGFASLPAFLTKDWTPGFNADDEIHMPHMPWELNEYRNVYARAMLEATGPDGDGKYTIKSALYEAINAGLYGGHSGGSVANVVYRLLKELSTTRTFVDKDILTRLARGGWELGEWRINTEITNFVAPQSKVEVVEPWFWSDPDQ